MTGCQQSETCTNGIRVIVRPFYLAGESTPQSDHYVFGYRVEIRNERERAVQLQRRRWLIIDADGLEEEVEGPGVVGYTPRLRPGESFRYTSYCPLSTPWGTMEGAFEMRGEAGRRFFARIGRFYLVSESPQPAAAMA